MYSQNVDITYFRLFFYSYFFSGETAIVHFIVYAYETTTCRCILFHTFSQLAASSADVHRPSSDLKMFGFDQCNLQHLQFFPHFLPASHQLLCTWAIHDRIPVFFNNVYLLHFAFRFSTWVVDLQLVGWVCLWDFDGQKNKMQCPLSVRCESVSNEIGTWLIYYVYVKRHWFSSRRPDVLVVDIGLGDTDSNGTRLGY